MKKGLLIAVLLALLTIPLGCKAPAEAPPPSPGPLPAAEFEVVSLNVMPPGVRVGETVSVTAEVKNTSDTEGTYAAILTIDGVEVERKDVTVAAGATETVTFTLVKDTPGTYEIAVGELSANLILKGKPQPVELKYDDGTSEGFWALGGHRRGHLVHFSPPAIPFTINAIKIYGNLYGTGYEHRNFQLEIWDEDFKVLHSCQEPHTRFSHEPGWVTVEIPDASVNTDFYIFVCTNSLREGGILIHYDSSAINEHSEVAHNGKIVDWDLETPKEKVNWMIRVVGSTPTELADIAEGLAYLGEDLRSLPEIEDGISTSEEGAINELAELIESNDPEVQQGLKMIDRYGVPQIPWCSYEIPDYNTQLRALFWLAEDNALDANYYTIALALALDYGSVLSISDEENCQQLRQYISAAYHYIKATDKVLEERDFPWRAKDHPLEVAIVLVWGANGLRFPYFYQEAGEERGRPWEHYWLNEFQSRKMSAADFDWLFVSVETLQELRDWMLKNGFTSSDLAKTANRLDTYMGKHLKYMTDKPGKPPSYFEVEGKITPGCRISNPDWQWRYFLEKKEIVGNCEDICFANCIFLKSVNIATLRGGVKSESFGHAVVLYYDRENATLRTTSHQLAVIGKHAKPPISYSIWKIPWDNFYDTKINAFEVISPDKKLLETGIAIDTLMPELDLS